MIFHPYSISYFTLSISLSSVDSIDYSSMVSFLPLTALFTSTWSNFERDLNLETTFRRLWCMSKYSQSIAPLLVLWHNFLSWTTGPSCMTFIYFYLFNDSNKHYMSTWKCHSAWGHLSFRTQHQHNKSQFCKSIDYLSMMLSVWS